MYIEAPVFSSILLDLAVSLYNSNKPNIIALKLLHLTTVCLCYPEVTRRTNHLLPLRLMFMFLVVLSGVMKRTYLSITSSVPFCRVCLRCLGRLELLVFPFGRDASLKSTNHVLYLINLLRQEMLQHWRHVPANLYHHSLSLALPAVFPSARVGFLVAFFFDLIL